MLTTQSRFVARCRRAFPLGARVCVTVLGLIALMGFQGKANLGVHPTPLCDFGCGGSELVASVLDTRQKLGSTPANLVVRLGTWSELERCDPGTGPAPPGTIDLGIKTCFFDVNGIAYDDLGRLCRCYYDLAGFESYLDTYVGAPASTGGLGVDAIVQLAPIFTTSRTVPPYLWKTAFKDPSMIAAFKLLWNAVSARLAQPKYQGRTFLISIGNEINLYLNMPTGAPKAGVVADEGMTELAWQSYKQFYQAASDHVRTGGSGTFTRLVGTTLTWFGCGGGRQVQQATVDASCAFIEEDFLPKPPSPNAGFKNAWVTDVIALSDVEVFTHYHRFGPAVPDSAIESTLTNDFFQMANLGYQQGKKPVFLQELGHPSGQADPGDGLLEHQQERMVVSSLDRIGGVNAAIRAIAGGWTPFEGFSFFHMHDFRTNVVDELFDCATQACPSGFTCQTTPAGDGRWHLRDATSGPGARQEPDLAFDLVRQRVMLFGGVEVPPSTPGPVGFTDVWVSDLPAHVSVPPAPWRQLETTGGPPSGNGSESVYVPTRDRLLVVSPNPATALTEFWSLELGADGTTGTWTQLLPSGPSVSQRPFGRAVYDSASDRVLYFGGRSGATTSSAELVILDLVPSTNGAVSVVDFTGTIPGREEFGFLFDNTANRALLYGGAGVGQGRLDDAWQIVFTTPQGAASALTQVGTTTPGRRTFFMWANDASQRRALLFGGLFGATDPGTLMSDVWKMDYATPGQLAWTELSPESAASGEPSPRGRIGAAGVFAPGGDRMFIYGGISDLAFTPLADTWELQLASRSKCVLASPGCISDAQCDAKAAAVNLPTGSLKCCTDGAFCSAAQLGTCIVPSVCDFATLLVPTTTCADGNASLCDPGDICNSAHKCIAPELRATFCSWGLIDGNGAAKPAWDAFLTNAGQFVP